MKNKLYWIVSILLIAAILLTKYCSPQEVKVKTTVLTKSDTIWLKPDTVYTENVVTEYRTITKVKEVPVAVVKKDTNIYTYSKANYFGDTIVVLDTIKVANNEIVSHKQRVILQDITVVKDRIVNIPIVVKDSVKVTNEIIKFRDFAPYAGVTFVPNARIVIPNVGVEFKRHYIGAGVVLTGNGVNGLSFNYKFRLRK